MFELDLDHFLNEKNWNLEYWGNNGCIFYSNRRMYLLRSGIFYSPLFTDISFSNDFLIKTKETKHIGMISDDQWCNGYGSEFNFYKNDYPKEILKQKLKQIKERSNIFTQEDMPCLN